MRDRFLRACRKEKVDRVPVWFMRQAGRYMEEYRRLRKKYSILEIAKTPKLASEVTLQPINAFPLDAAIIFSDILIPLEPMGIKVEFSPKPTIKNPVKRPSCLKRLKDFKTEEKLAFVGEAISLTIPKLDGLPLIGFSAAPFTLASYLIEGGPSKDFLKTKIFMHQHPEAWKSLMDKLVKTLSDYLNLQVKSGARALQIFDSWIGAVSPADYRDYIQPHSRSLIQNAQKTKVPVIHFGTGQNGFLEDFAEAGGDVIGVDWRIDIKEAFKRIGNKALQGNLDPSLLLGDAKNLKRGIDSILSQVGTKKGFIFNIGHGLFPQTNPKLVKEAVHQVHSFHG
jgi:uroporphyrinogen decarboxylase